MSQRPVAPAAPPSRSLPWYLLLFFLCTTVFFAGTTVILDRQQKRAATSVTGGTLSCQVYFSPDGGCTDAIVNALAAAHSRVLVQAYTFTAKPIAQALLDAKKRGVEVRIILDKSQRTERYSEADFFAHMGIPTFIDPVHAIAHNKIMIIDNNTVITGSFNFTKAAEEHNAENLLVLHSTDLASAVYQKLGVPPVALRILCR